MNYRRRDFLKVTSALASGIALTGIGSSFAACNSTSKLAGSKNKFGLQLYSLRDDLPKDPRGVLKQVASYGYNQVESFEGPKGMFWGMSNTEFKRYMDDLGMKIVSSHCDIDKNFQQKAEEAA